MFIYTVAKMTLGVLIHGSTTRMMTLVCIVCVNVWVAEE